jgi:hypothetical protein
MMDKRLQSTLNDIFDAVYVYSPSEYSIGGQRFTATDSLVTHLQNQFYNSCYSREFRIPIDSAVPGLDQDTLLPQLQAANQTRERWDYGWKITQVLPDSSLGVQKESQNRVVWPGEYILMETGVSAQPGAWARVFLSKEDTRSQPGFYIAQPEIASSYEDYQTLVRFYWDLKAEGAPQLVRLVTERFNQLRVPFQFKTLRYQSQYERADSAVLFVGWRYIAIAIRLCAEVHRAIKENLKQNTPLFTKRLAPGLGLAEDPSAGTSFGMLRSRLLAEAICKAYEKRMQSQKARMAEWLGLMEANGLNADLPHLSISAIDHYPSEAEFAAL